MSSSPDSLRLNRIVQSLYLCAGGGVGGAPIGALEGRWVAHRDFIPTTAFSAELLSICLTYTLLLGGVGFLIGLARKWHRPDRIFCCFMLACAVWILPYQSTATWATILGIAITTALCALFLLSSSKQRRIYSLFGAVLFLALLTGYPNSASRSVHAEPKDLPNIVLVVIDTLRADAISSDLESPRTKDVSPVIDSIASSGVRFGNAYAQAPWTRPSTASLFTGLYPASHGIVTPFDPLNTALPTMASMLQERGYQTIGFSANPQISPAFGFHNGFDRFWSSTARLKDRSAGVRLVRKWGVGKTEEQPTRGVLHSTADDVNHAVEDWLACGPVDAPTFLYVHYLDPHDPYTAPEDLLGQPSFADVQEASLYASQELPPFPLEGSSLPELSPLQLGELQRRYDTEIRFVDDRLGKMLESLRDAGVWSDQDYLIITSDHGEEFHEHQQWQHGRSLFEEMIHVPLIMVGPNVPADSVVPDLVELVDVLPTIAAWTGNSPGFVQHGENLFGQKTKVGAFSHRPRQRHPIWSLRVANQKVIWVQNGKQWVKLAFNLNADPLEAHPLVAEGGEAFFGLHERLEELIDSSAEYRQAGSGSIKLDASSAQDLEQLGYIDGAE